MVNRNELVIPFDTETLRKMVLSGDRDDQAAAARRIWTDWEYLDNPNSLQSISPVLYKLLNWDTDERNSWHYMISLGSLNYVEVLPYLTDKLRYSPSDNTKGFAAEAIGRFNLKNLTQEALGVVWEMIENSSPLVVKINCIRALRNYYFASQNDDVALKLIGLLDEQDNELVQSTIVETLGAIGNLEVTPNLIHLMITRRTEVDKRTTAGALDKIAKLNGLNDRKELMDKFGFTTLE